MNESLNKALSNYIMNPKNALYNFTLGRCYEEIGHTASAASFYIRTTEFGYDDNLTYEALLRIALCFEIQGSRIFTVKGILLRAVSLLPNRPEGYFLLSRIYERNKEWQEAYTWSVIGDKEYGSLQLLRTNVEYPGKYGFMFEKAVASWWIGLWDESLYLFRKLSNRSDLTDIYITAVKYNLLRLSNNWKNPIPYDDSLYEYLKVKFKGSSTIEKNYSQCYQDMFVLTMLDGKKNGRYLEIGSGDPLYGNNTALLEKEFNWIGMSIDINSESIKLFKENRKNECMIADASRIDYKTLLKSNEYDYLQIDCDPAMTSYQVLLRIPFEDHKFAVITFEHDHYADEQSNIRNKSREYLKSHGYIMIVGDIAPNHFDSFEDWWIYPDLVDQSIIDKMLDLSSGVKKADDYILNRI